LKHLAELHIGEGLEQYADEVHMRALIMQSNLDNTVIALSHIKNVAHARLTAGSEEFQDDQASPEFLRKTDALITQIRSVKVVAGKATRQLEDLQKCSMTLDPSTKSSIEQIQQSTSDLATSTQKTSSSIFKLLQEEDRNIPFTSQDLLRVISSSDAQPLSSLNPQIQSATTQLQAFYNLTNSLTQTVELPSPAPPPPWQILARNMRAATATSATYEIEVGRLKDEMAEKNRALALREKEVEEMSVKVEVLAKRVGESGGRREKVRELEGAVEIARVKEQDLLSNLAQLQRNLRDLESEREAWKKAPQHQPLPADLSNPNADRSPSSRRQIQALESEIADLQSSIRYLRKVTHHHTLSSSLSFLSAPLITLPTAPTTTIQSEAADVLREMLHLVTRPENQIVKLKSVPTEERLKWRPARETSKWVVGRQTEDWQTWKEWRNSVTEKATRDGIAGAGSGRVGSEKEMTMGRGRPRKTGEPVVIARVETTTKAGARGDVRVVSPGEWEDVERVLGLSGLGFSEGLSTLG
jgi:dynactin 1